MGALAAAALTCSATSPEDQNRPELASSIAPDSPPHTAFEPRFARIAEVPRGVVASLAQDRTGFIWFGGGNGLTRFDGYRLQVVDRQTASPARRNLGWIRALLAGEDGRLWIGTEADGIAVHDPASGRITDVPYGGPGIPPTVFALAADGSGGLWVGTAGAGLQHYSPSPSGLQRDAAVFASPDVPGGPGDRVLSLLRAHDGALWVGSDRGLARLRPGAGQLKAVALPPAPMVGGSVPDAVQALRQMADGRIWIGTQLGRLAIAAADGSAVQWLDAAEAPGASAQVTALAQDKDGTVWVGRARGIDLRAHDGRLLRQLTHDARRPSGLAGNEVTSLLVDRAGSVWVGGLGLGLQRHDPGHRALQWREADLDGVGPFTDADVRALLRHPDGSVWAAARGGDVVRFDARLQQAELLVSRQRTGRAPIAAMAAQRDGRVWLAEPDHLQQRAANGALLRQVPHAAGEIRQMVEHADGSLWLAAQAGLFRLPAGAPKPQALRTADGNVLRQQMFVLAARRDGAVWAGSVGGLYLAAADGSVVRPARFAGDAGLANPIVIGLLIDSKGRLWIDTAVTGLHHATDAEADVLRLDSLSVRHGVTGHPFGANLLEDSRGRIWTHMSMYDAQGDRLVELTAADGAALGTGWFGSYAATADGRLLFGSNRGILSVEAEAFDPHGAPPPLAVAGLRVNGTARPTGQLQQLVLGSRDRFSIEIAGLDFVSTARTRYRFRLEGMDAQWSAGNADVRSMAYGNLEPGRYKLQAQVAAGDGPWSAPLEVTVHVDPAWWQTGVVRVAAVLAFGMTIFGLLQWRTRHLRARQAALEIRVGERTAALQALTIELEREKIALVESTFTDPLTGLRNRRFLTQQIEADISLSRRRHSETLQHGALAPADADMVFFIIDIDHFKSVNDVHGHAAGDAVIQQMGDRLRAVFRDSDHLVRWGGEEFLVVARGTSRQHAAYLAERVRGTVADTPFVLDSGKPLRKTCSVGYCCFPLSHSQPAALGWTETVQLADAALLAVKAGGRNGWLGLREGDSLSATTLQAIVRQQVAEWRSISGLRIDGLPRLNPTR